MAYFPNAFKQVFVPYIKDMVVTGSTADLKSGEYGFFDAETWTAVPQQFADIKVHPKVVLAYGSTHTTDKIGSHGGYKESIKSKPIDPKQVHRFWKIKGRSPRNQIIAVGYDQTNANTAPTFEKGKQYLLRIDLKGSAVLRFLKRNAYHTFDANTGCIDTCSDPCSPAAKVDPLTVLIQWAKQIKNDPIFSKFINPMVYIDNGSGITTIDPDTYVPVTDEAGIALIRAGMELQMAYADTKFSDFSFDVRDHYELEPVLIIASIVDEGGDPCKIPYLSVKETQPPLHADGTGETVLRDWILFNRYRQEPFQTDPRRKETEDIYSVQLKVPRFAIFNNYYILYSVPRKNNPSGTLDSDQYLLQFSAGSTLDMTSFEQWVQAYLDSAGNGVKLEDLSLSSI